ncbi:unnamed protein product [Bursaphelenchus xylophilus]|uniref:(pine wood nematode) hypothetical protein n=1 Tax=Bursaphelenchus xylophilus TaxID=6326 RepID=A0A1I7S3S9_BURXY|nr:unnamed protein product [Bursaphelenchus xylophilus]CAG9116500.1 unnamed protein product [Bursaphelenchus xylophilus]
MHSVLLMMTLAMISDPACGNDVERFVFDPTNLEALFHSNGISAFLKAKANSVLKEVHRDDVIVFSECIRNKTSPLLYSRCLVSLMNSRDRMKANLNDPWDSNIVDDVAQLLKPPMKSTPTVKFKKKSIGIWKEQHKKLRNVIKTGSSSIMRPLRGLNLLTGHLMRKRRRVYESPFKNVLKIQKMQDFFSKMEHCNNYFRKIKEENERVLSSYGYKAKFETKNEGLIEEMLQKLQAILEDLDFQKISVLSPKILALFPNSKRPQFLSPEILNFQNTGILPLPQLFKLISSSDSEALFWMELLLEMVGASEKLDSFLEMYSAEMTRMDSFIYPRILERERKEYLLKKALDASTTKQSRELEEIGFTFLSRGQARLLFGSEEAAIYDGVDAKGRDKKLEERIRKISELEENQIKLRGKRQEPGPEGERREGPFSGLHVLEPFAFISNLRSPPVLEGLILSPHAFVTEILRPELLTTDILSPRAFIPTILSPQALISRVLSPAAFRLELLSPTALIAWVATPEALIADILSPRMLETRIASPEFLTVQILSPSLLSPKFGSDETLSFNVLSPNILSPRFESKEKMVVEILSPHILGGGHQPSDSQIQNQP